MTDKVTTKFWLDDKMRIKCLFFLKKFGIWGCFYALMHFNTYLWTVFYPKYFFVTKSNVYSFYAYCIIVLMVCRDWYWGLDMLYITIKWLSENGLMIVWNGSSIDIYMILIGSSIICWIWQLWSFVVLQKCLGHYRNCCSLWFFAGSISVFKGDDYCRCCI